MKRLLLLVALISLLSGCSFHKASLIPVIEGQRLSQIEASMLLDEIAATSSALRSYKALTINSVKRGDERQRFRQVLVFSNRNRSRVETLPTTAGFATNIMIVSDDKLVFLDSVEKTAYSGLASTNLISKLTHVKASPQELITLATGIVPQSCLDPKLVSVYLDSKSGSVTIVRSDNSYLCLVDTKNLHLKELRIIDPFRELVSLVVRYDEYSEGGQSPKVISLTVPSDSLEIEIKVLHALANPFVSSELFDLSIPEGFKESDI